MTKCVSDGKFGSPITQLKSPLAASSPPPPSHTPSTFDNIQIEEDSSDYQTVMRLLENGEKISQMERCARIQGLDTHEGLLLFGYPAILWEVH